MFLEAAQGINLMVRLAVELAALMALAAWGWNRGGRLWARASLTAALPTAAATVWALFAAPGASVALSAAGRVAVQVVVLGAAAVALWAMGRRRTSATFVTVAVVNALLMAVWGQ